jgi:hypothetical protein
MSAVTTDTARVATCVACSPRIQAGRAEAGPPRRECGRGTPSPKARSPRRRPGDSARPGRSPTRSGAIRHSQDGGRGDRAHPRLAPGPARCATSGCTTHPASASTRPGAPVRMPRARGRAVPQRAAIVRPDGDGRSEPGLPRQRRRQRSSGSFADHHQRPRGWLPIRADGRRTRWRRTHPDRRMQHGTSQLRRRLLSVPFHPSVASRAHRTCWEQFTGQRAERLDG